MRIREGFVVREIKDAIVAVPTGDIVREFGGIVNLNATGKFMWEVLEEDRTVEEVAERLVEKYHIDKDKAMKSAEMFIQQLREANVIVE